MLNFFDSVSCETIIAENEAYEQVLAMVRLRSGGVLMREKFNHLYLDSHERKLLIHSLVELKNQLIQQGRYTDCVDELIFKVINAPTKRMKIEYV